jgi:hypothetical protein
MVRLILVLSAAFAWLVRLLGGDDKQFRAILETKLILDSRRPMVGFSNRKERESGGAFTGAMVFYAMIGLFLGGILLKVGSPLVGMTIVHAIVLVMLTTTLIGDFTNVLLDTTDNAIVQPRPVSGRTLFLARTAHICTYLGLLGISLSLVTLCVGAYRWSWLFPLVYLATLGAAIMLAVCLASLFYLVALRITHHERVRDIVLYIQILFSVFIFGGYQFLPRLIDMTQLEVTRIDDRLWIYLFPPAWLAGAFDILAGRAGQPQIILTMLAATVPPVAMLLITRGLATRFNQMLAAMESSVERRSKPQTPAMRRSLAARLGRLISRRSDTQAAFAFIWTILSRDRLFKARMYPSLAILLIVPFSMLLSDPRGLRAVLEDLPNTSRHLVPLYLACITFPPAIIQLRYSPYWQASWVYESLPLERPGEVLLAGVWVLLFRFVLPAYLVISAVLLGIWGLRILPDIALSVLVTVAMALAEGILLGKHLPHSRQMGVSEGAGRMGKNLLLILVAMVLGGIHYALLPRTWGVPVAATGCLILIVVLSSVYRSTSWASLEGMSSRR